MSDRIIETSEVIEKIAEALRKAEGDDIADLHNKIVDGPKITYEGSGLFIKEMR